MSKSVVHPRSTSYNSTEDEVDIDEEPIDTGLIRCICNSSEDDGFTIQCERCLVWQHAFCVKISQNNIPEHYLCDQCEKKVVNNSTRGNNNKAWRDQLDQFNQTVENEVRPTTTTTIASTALERNKQFQQPRRQLQHQQHPSDFNSNNIGNGINNDSNSKHHFRDIHNRMGGDDDVKSSRKKNPVGRPPKKPKLSKKISVSKRSLQELELQDSNGGDNNNNINNTAVGFPRKRRQEITIGESSNNNHSRPSSSSSNNNSNRCTGGSDFQPINFNNIRSKHAKQVFREARERLARLEKGKGKFVNGNTTAVAATPISHHIVFEEDLYKQDSTSKTDIQPLFNKRYSKTPTNATSLTEIPTTISTTSIDERRQGLFANDDIEQNQLVAEVHGDIILKSEYKFDPGNDFAVLGTPSAYVFFYPTLDLCIDARYRGNNTRKIRRSCHPNAELRSIVTSTTALIPSADQEIRLGIFSRTKIEKGDEITIGYSWQRGHISWKKNLEWHDCGITDGHQVIDEEEERSSRTALTRMLTRFANEFGECACQDINLCFIEHLKAIRSGSDGRPLTTYRPSSSSKQDVLRNGTASRAEGEYYSSTRTVSNPILASTQPPSSRQSANNAPKTEYPSKAMESVEDNIVIDVVSTTPLARSPVISASAATSGATTGIVDTEEELDVDGDVDIGEGATSANYANNKSIRRRHHRTNSDHSMSADGGVSGSSYAGSDTELRKSGKRVRSPSSNRMDGEISSKRHSSSGAPKLPRKKAWVRHFMQQTTVPSPPSSTVAMSHDSLSKDETNVTSIKQNQFTLSSPKENTTHGSEHPTTPQKIEGYEQPPGIEKEAHQTNATPPSKVNTPQTTTIIDMDVDEDDGELSDASSASTIPIMDRDDDRLMDLTPSSSEVNKDSVFDHLGSNKDDEISVKEEHSAVLSPQNPTLDNQPSSESTMPEEHPELVSTKESTAVQQPVEKTEQSVAAPQQPKAVEGKSNDEQKQVESTAATEQQLESKAEAAVDSNEERGGLSETVIPQQDKKGPENETPAVPATIVNNNSEVDEHKPTKVKLSLQEYLARRGTSNQGSVRVSATEDKSSQDCSSKTEEQHPWITATSQVEVTMETRPSEAQ